MTDHKTLIGELRAAADECLYDTANLCRRAADALEAATTEWEYGHEGDTLIGVHANPSREHTVEEAAQLTRYWERHGKKRFRAVRRRKAGPWLPVEGERNGDS